MFDLLRKNNDLKVLACLLTLGLIASTILVSSIVLDWFLRGIEASEVKVAAAETISTPAPTVTLLPTATTIPSTPTITPTPIADQYDFDGINFGLISEFEILNGPGFQNEDSKNATLRLNFPDDQMVELSFLPIPYFDWMGEYFWKYCPFESKKGCVYAQDGNLTINVHTGCVKGDPEPAVAEELGAVLDSRALCGYPSIAPDPSHYKAAEGSSGTLIQGYDSLEVTLLQVEYIPPEKLNEFSISLAPSDIAEFIGRKEGNKRLIYLITSSRLKGCEPEFSCGRWLLILEGKS